MTVLRMNYYRIVKSGQISLLFFLCIFFVKMRSEKLRIFTIDFFRSPYLRIFNSL